MKLTWFAGTTIRIHIGGSILVADPQLAPAGVDPGELVSGAERTFALAFADGALAPIDAARWRPRVSPRAIDEDALLPVLLHRLGGGVLVDAAGEPPLVLASGGEALVLGRWARDAAVVLFGGADALIATGVALLTDSPPRLLALAADEGAVDGALPVLREQLEETALLALEPGLAVEI